MKHLTTLGVLALFVLTSCGAAPAQVAPKDDSIYGVLRQTENAKAFMFQVEKFPDLRERMQTKTGSGITIFAPSNEALTALSVVDNASLHDALARHIVTELLDEGDLSEQGVVRELPTAGSGTLMLGATQTQYMLGNTPFSLLSPTISGNNGNAFVIDRLIQ